MSDLPEGFKFEEPPPAQRGVRGQSKYAPLMEHPGEWALIVASTKHPQGSQTAARLRRSLGGRWEAADRTNEDGTWRTYLRYLGPDDSDG